ncbi:MAG: PEGA domain-containing protein [Desulfarculus sp.]|nr:MAG: PEGA domain-containing protein [Desulfarculus sp.]
MKRHALFQPGWPVPALPLLLALLLFSPGPAPAAPAAGRISEVKAARGVVAGRPLGVSQVFTPEVNPIYVWFRLEGVAPGSQLRSVWYYLGGAAPRRIGQSTLASSADSDWGQFSFELAPGKRWPLGRYRVELHLSGQKAAAAAFEVRPASTPRAAPAARPAPQPAPAAVPGRGPWRRVGNTAFSFDAPADWQGQCQNPQAATPCTFYLKDRRNLWQAFLEVKPTSPGSTMSAAQLAGKWIGWQQRAHQGYTAGPITPLRLGPLSGVEFVSGEYRNGHTGQRLRQRLALVQVKPGQFLMLDYQAPPELYQTHLEAYLRARDSLALRPPGAPAPAAPAAAEAGPAPGVAPAPPVPVAPRPKPAPAPPAAPAARPRPPAAAQPAWAREQPEIERRRQARLAHTQALDEFNAGRYEQAVRLLEQYLAVLPEDGQAKKVLALARQQVRAAKNGGLQVSSTPPAQVFLDGRPLGRTPLNIKELPVGRYKLEAREGKLSQSHDLEIKPRTTTTVEFDLRRRVEVQVIRPPANQYRHPKLGFLLQTPPGWRIEEPAASAELRLRPPTGEGLIQVNSSAVAQRQELDGYVRIWEEAFFAANNPLREKVSGRSLNLGGAPAYEAVYQGGGMKAKMAFLAFPRRIYVLSGIFPQAEFDQGAQLLDQVVKSFRPQ